MNKRVVGLMGSYRKAGAVDTLVRAVLDEARRGGAEVEQIDLVDRRVEFCRNCRECCHEPGAARGRCQIEDDASAILGRLEQADAIVLGAPVNFGDVNALTRRLLERMIGYTYWPPGAKAPTLRDDRPRKKAVLVTTSAAPALATRLLQRPALRTLRRMARLLGARPAATLVAGKVPSSWFEPSGRQRRQARSAARKLLA